MTLKDSIHDLTQEIFAVLTNYSKMVYVQDQVRLPLGEIEQEENFSRFIEFFSNKFYL
jgi:hypothetical protein